MTDNDVNTTLAQPEPEGPTDEEIDALERDHWQSTGVVNESLQQEELFNYRAFLRAGLARWGRHLIPPVADGVADKPTLQEEALVALERIRSGDVSNGSDDFLFVECALRQCARPTLAQPEPEGPTEHYIAELAEDIEWKQLPQDEATRSSFLLEFARAVIARYAPLAQPEPESAFTHLAARPLLERVARMADCIDQRTVGEIIAISNQAEVWLSGNPPGQPVAIEPRGCPTPGACSCVEPAAQPKPVAPTVMEIIAMADEIEEEELGQVDLVRRALARWGRPAIQPVAVAERPWERENGWLDLDGECWWCPPKGTPYWQMANPAMVYDGWLLPHHALPIPQPTQLPNTP
jgi:hypothetical protein